MAMDRNRLNIHKRFRASSWAPVLALLLSGGFAANAHAQALGIPVSARQNAAEGFSNAQVDQALQRATAVLSGADGPGDFACMDTFLRQGNLGVFTGPNNIVSEVDLRAVLAEGSNVKVVDDVDFCADMMNVNILGCTALNSTVLEDVTDPTSTGPSPALDGILWAHEFGHEVGLVDLDPATSSNFIMSALISTSSNFVDALQCNAYLAADSINFPPPFTPISPFPGGARIAESGAKSQQPAVPIEEFVKGVMVDVMPVDAMLRYGPAEVPVLIQMLSDRSAANTWPMVTMVLGMIGDDTTASRLIEFIETEREGVISRGEYQGVRSAIQSLGFLASRVQSGVALDYLMKASDPEFWTNQRTMSWTSAAVRTVDARDRALTRVADIGLGLSGDPQALEMLQTRWEEMALGRGFVQGREDMLHLLEQSMLDNQKIARIGLADYYRGGK